MDSNGRTIWIADAHRGDGKHFVVHADEKLTAFVELEAAILQLGASITFAPAFQLPADFHISQTTANELINNVLFTPPGVEVESCRDGRRLPDKRDQAVTDFFRVGVVAIQFPLQKSLLEYAPHCQHRNGNDRQQSRRI